MFGIELEEINGNDVYVGNVLVSPGYISDFSSVLKGNALSLFVGVLNSYFNSGNGKVLALETAASLYNRITGNDINPFKTYDIVVTVDSRHRDNPASSYLSITKDGTVMETPIIYPNDQVAVGTRGFLGVGFTPLVYVPLGGSSPVSPEYQSIFDKLIKNTDEAIYEN